MKDSDQIQSRIDTINDVITFAGLLKLNTVAIDNLKSFVKILEWVLSDDY